MTCYIYISMHVHVCISTYVYMHDMKWEIHYTNIMSPVTAYAGICSFVHRWHNSVLYCGSISSVMTCMYSRVLRNYKTMWLYCYKYNIYECLCQYIAKSVFRIIPNVVVSFKIMIMSFQFYIWYYMHVYLWISRDNNYSTMEIWS